jgi:carbon-monoxide dehydrogenase medium subunit
VRSFDYVRPETLDDVLAILAEHGPAARLLAGGTDLLVRLRLGHIQPAVVVDLKRVTALRGDIVDTDGAIRVGARTTMTDLIEDVRVRRRFPALVEAAKVVGSVQIRNRATLAGNICNASPAADTAPALLVYGARVNVIGAAGARQVPVADFFVGPGKTVLGRGEIVESIDLPVPDRPTGAAFGRVTRRKGVDLATINLCCLVSEPGPVRFAYGAVGPRPFVVDDETGALSAPAPDEGAITAAIDRLVAEARPISDVRGSREYRSAMLAVMTRRTWAIATSRLKDRKAQS